MSADREPYLVKVVRDRVQESMLNGEHRIVYKRIVDRAELVEFLKRKLGEELIEYMLNPSVDELGDILATTAALAKHDLHVDWIEVEAAATAKYRRRGGFEIGTGMYAVPV